MSIFSGLISGSSATIGGNVGIGTASPTAKLDVSGSIALGGVTFAAYDSNYTRISRRDGSVGMYLGGSDAANYYDNTNHYFRDRGGVSWMHIDTSTGRVGMGTTSPNTKLHIYTASVSSDYNFIKVQMPSWASSQNYLKNIIWSDGSDVGAIGMKYDGSRTNMHFHSFYNGGYTTSASVMMAINGDGNVGIGTTNPSNKLQIQGNVSASSYTSSITGAVGFVGTASYAVNAANGVTINSNVDNYLVTATGTTGTLQGESGLTFNGTALSVSSNAQVMNLIGTDHVYVAFYPDGSGAGRKAYIGYGGAADDTLTIANETGSGHIRLEPASGQSVGIGATPTFTAGSGLEVQRSSATATLRLDSAVFATELRGLTDGTQLYQLSAGYLDLGTGNATKMRIDSSGNVGIGTTSPFDSAKLDVRSGKIVAGTNTSTGGSVTIQNYYTDGAISLWGSMYSSGGPLMGYGVKSSTGSANTFFSSTGINISRGAYIIEGNIHRWYNGAGQTVAIDSAVTMTERMTMDANGNIGIGTASPSVALDVAGSAARIGSGVSTADASLGIGENRSGNGYAYIDLVGDTTYTDYGLRLIRGNTGANASSYLQHRGTGDVGIYAQDAASVVFGTNNTERMRISASGNIGIGTVSPSTKLHVVGGSVRVDTVGGTLILNDTTSGTDAATSNYISFQRAGTEKAWVGFGDATNGIVRLQNTIGTVRVAASGEVQLWSANSQTVTVDTSNRVGIGNTAPDVKLSVIGTNGLPASSGATPNGVVRIKGTTNSAMFLGNDGSSPFGAWLQVQDITGLGTYYPLLLNPNGGNVGVGTSNPGTTLHIQGNVSASSYTSSINNAIGYFGTSSWSVSASRASSSAMVDVISGGSTTGLGTYSGSFYGTLDSPATSTSEGGQVTLRGPTGGLYRYNVDNYQNSFRIFREDDSTAANGVVHVFVSSSGNVGIGTITPSTKLEVSGSQRIAGGALGVNVTASATLGRIDASNDIVAYSSDKRLKTNIELISNSIDKVLFLNGFTFNWNDIAHNLAGYDTESKQVGVYAQEVQNVLPEAVKLAPFDNDGTDRSISGENYLTVQYEKLVPLLIEAIKELKTEVDELKRRLE